MMLVLIILSVIAIIITLKHDEYAFICIPAFVLGFSAFVSIVLIAYIVDGRVLDRKIDLIESKNVEIEEKIEVSVKTYMDYEKSTFDGLKSENYIQLVNLYPELKSDELIKSEINLYQENTKEIIELKKQKIELSNHKWWLYFGK